MLKLILLIVVLLVVAVVIYASTQPDTFSIVRQLKIKATPEKIFSEINDFSRWTLWSPWEHKDPAMQRIFSDNTAGVGASYEWIGNKEVGHGKMEIVESNSPQKILIKLDFFTPFEAHNMAEFTFIPDGDETTVVWNMYGPQVFIGKIMCMFMNMDKMVGKDFEAGLAKLKEITE